jgi:hypothetical protein
MATHSPLAKGERRTRLTGQILYLDLRHLAGNPASFFRESAVRRSVLVPVLIGLLSIQVAVLAGGLLSLADIDGIQGAAYVILYWAGIATGQHMVGQDLTGAGLIGAIALAPVLGALLLLGATVLIHSLVVLAVGDSNTGFRNTLRVVGYASVVNLVNWVPVVGLPLNLIGLALVAIGIREMHRTTALRATIVSLTPIVAFLVFFTLLQVLPE